MQIPRGASQARVPLEHRVLLFGGVFLAFVGLWLYAGADGRIDRFLNSAMVFVGTLMAFPPLVVQAMRTRAGE
jgi:hypothetical protein